MTDPVLASITPAALGETLKDLGYRVEQVAHETGVPELRSASQGLGFFIRFGNPLDGGRFHDFTFNCVLAVEGPLPAVLVDSWNRSKRFARLWTLDANLMLSLDVSVAGGVTAEHLKSQCLLWDRLVQEFVLHLGRTAGTDGKAAATGAAATAASA